jgi:hypothetical protein
VRAREPTIFQDISMSSHSDDQGQVMRFRPPRSGGKSRRRASNASDSNIVRLLDLSKYERPREAPDEFKARMRENLAALIALGLLVGIAATDFTDIEQLQHCTATSECGN